VTNSDKAFAANLEANQTTAFDEVLGRLAPGSSSLGAFVLTPH
jgi:hypothetical protein